VNPSRSRCTCPRATHRAARSVIPSSSFFLGTDCAEPHPRIDGFVLAPSGHGDAFYRGPGETEVLRTLDWVLANYPVDPARVSITGISMGGTGAAHFALRFTDRFSAGAALAGYHSYFVRRDVRGRPLRPWEWTELARFSPASYAENGLGFFLYLTQGTKDLPLLHTTVLAGRYKELGYPFKEAYPDTGHDVYRVAWAGGGLYPMLARFERPPPLEAKRVVLKTDSLRLGTRRWVKVTALSSSAVPATISARVTANDAIAVDADGIDAFELARPAPVVSEGASTTVQIGGERIAFPASEPIRVHREGAAWMAGPLPPTAAPFAKKPGAEGPFRDVYSAPLTFVYGTLDPRETRLAREVAEYFRARASGNARFPVVPDTDTRAMVGRNLFLVGSRTSNRVVQRLEAKLPFGIVRGANGAVVRLGTFTLAGDAELGVVAVHPNPEDPAHLLAVVEGATVRGLVRAMSLPQQIPDFIAFDSALAPATGEQVLGQARVLAGGYFDRTWSVPRDRQAIADAPLPPSGPHAAHLSGHGLRAFASERRSLASVEPAPPP
jgi:hypothetical protein